MILLKPEKGDKANSDKADSKSAAKVNISLRIKYDSSCRNWPRDYRPN